MAIGPKKQIDATLYALIVFVALFIIALALAVIFFIKAEGYKASAATLQNQTNELATSAELRKMGAMIGEHRQKSGLGTLLAYIDELTNLIVGGAPEENSAEIKVNTVRQRAKNTLDMLAKEHPDANIGDPNTSGLIRIIEKLNTRLDNAETLAQASEEHLKDLQKRFDDAMATSAEKEQILSSEMEKYQQQITDAQKDYNELKALTKQTSEQQVQNLMGQLDIEKANSKKLNQELLKTQAELKMAQERIKQIQEKLQAIVPLPDSEVAAFKGDAKIILIDNSAKTVHLNIGSSDRVYRGLTFSVYDKNMPIPKDGKGKAEIEVFDVGKNISAARIISSDPKRPLILDDVAANLIWDSSKTNVFAVAGEFDLNGDGNVDYDAAEKIKALIEKWGGKVEEAVSINTDFLILGSAPETRKKPTFEQIAADPMAMEKYEASLQKITRYQEAQSQAQGLSVPIFNIERFLYFIGYKSQSNRPGAF